LIEEGATIFAYPVRDPQRYGVVDFDDHGNALSLEEKPAHPRSNFAVPGLYYYDQRVVSFAKALKPSTRGEIEITDLNKLYLEQKQLHVQQLGRGIAWLDAGTHESRLQAANLIQAVQERQGIMISCPEEIAYRMGYISLVDLKALARSYSNSYGDYLTWLTENESK
jgi:glucose-1-phosphate thymidylyltransferase